MKVALLTYNLGQNYGGMLQAYALMHTLKKLGHKPELLYLQTKYHKDIKYWIKKNILGSFSTKYDYIKYEKEIFERPFYFVEKYISPKTRPLDSDDELINAINSDYDAYVVGSDQVWRANMYKYIDHAYFGYVENKEAVFLSYAPSFGVEHWVYSDEQTKKYKQQIERFAGVSVREESGVKLCKDYFDKESVHVLDPTALLDSSDYIELANKECEPDHNGEMLVYILDESKYKDEVIEELSKLLQHTTYTVGPQKKRSNKLDEMIYPSVTSWLKGFDDAKYVVTDSFHGCVFSVIFNKPFLVFGNEKRGMARFQSFLKMVGLEERLITNLDEFSIEKCTKKINWVQVNERLDLIRSKSIDFLNSNLKAK